MSVEGQNMRAIAEAKAAHNVACPFPPHTVVMAQFELDRMGWEVGDTIAGLTLDVASGLGTGQFRLLCEGNTPTAADETDAAVDAVASEPVPA